ncbi:MAG: hypothetical protein ACRED9_05015 [Caulobacteraceae bacterium]
MNKVQVTRYEGPRLRSVVEYLNGNGGLIDSLGELAQRGRVFAVVDPPDGRELAIDNGFSPPGAGAVALLRPIARALLEAHAAPLVLVQDPWLPAEEYRDEAQPFGREARQFAWREIEGQVYIQVDTTSFDASLKAIMRMASFLLAVIFLRNGPWPSSASEMVERCFAAAITHFDRQGWLLWLEDKVAQRLGDELPTG